MWGREMEGYDRHLIFFFNLFWKLSLHSPSVNSSSLVLWETNPVYSLSPCASEVVVSQLYIKYTDNSRNWTLKSVGFASSVSMAVSTEVEVSFFSPTIWKLDQRGEIGGGRMKYIASNFFLSQVCKLSVVSQVVLRPPLTWLFEVTPHHHYLHAYFPTSFGCPNLFVFLTSHCST